MSNVTVEQLEAAQDVTPIVSVENLYNLTDRGSDPQLEICERNGLAFLPFHPLGLGKLARPRGVRAELAARVQASPAQIAVAWLLHDSPAILPIPGTSSVTHLEENVAAATLQLTADQLDRLTAPGIA